MHSTGTGAAFKDSGRIVIVGASLAGLRAAETLRAEGFAGPLTIIGDEPYLPYDRPPLTKAVLTGWVPAEQTTLPRLKILADVEWRLGVAATGLDLPAKRVRLADGHTVAFDRLLIASGTREQPWPEQAEAELEGVFTLRGRDDAKLLRQRLAARPRRVLVIGGGFTGSEVAFACRELDLPVTVTERGAAPLVGALGGMIAGRVATLQREAGVDLRCQMTITSLEGDAQGRLRCAHLSDGSTLDTEVAVALGAMRNTEWLRDCGLAAGAFGVGDVARFPHPLYDYQFLALEHWSNAVEQATVAAHNMICAPAQRRPHVAVPTFWSSQFGVNIKSVGVPSAAEEVVITQGRLSDARFVAAYGQEGLLVASMTFNQAMWLEFYQRLIEQAALFPPNLLGVDQPTSTDPVPAAFPDPREPSHEVTVILTGYDPNEQAHAGNQASPQSSEPAREVTWHRIQWWMCILKAQIRLVASTLSIMWRRQQVWLHQYGAAIVSGLVFFTIIAIYNLLWTRFTILQTPDTWYGQTQYYLLYAWLLAVPQTVVNLQGFLFTHPRAPIFTLDSAWDALHTPLHIRIVTRGTNPGTVQRTIEADRAVIAAFTDLHGLRPRVTIEVVTDNRVPIDMAQYVVPSDFKTPHGALFKARALQYAVGAVPVAHNAWILHCDEETHITLSGLTGCLQFMQQEIGTVNSGEYPAVGQGAILYHRDFWLRPFLTLADSMRTALDFGYFRVQYHVWHRPLFGLHGSFILVRQDIERAVDFDFDSYRSITEDAYWALRLVDRGIGLKWVHGFLSEQATFSVQDFLRQRKRWFTGLCHVLAGEGVRWRTKLVLRASVVSWAYGLLGTLAIAIQLIHPIFVPWYILLPASLCLATYTSITVYGLLVNLHELHLQTHGISWLIVLAQIALGPIFAGLEGTAILWALFTLNTVKFYVVKK